MFLSQTAKILMLVTALFAMHLDANEIESDRFSKFVEASKGNASSQKLFKSIDFDLLTEVTFSSSPIFMDTKVIDKIVDFTTGKIERTEVSYDGQSKTYILVLDEEEFHDRLKVLYVYIETNSSLPYLPLTINSK